MTSVSSLDSVAPGDHIQWKRSLGYNHHAIVEHVDQTNGKIHVIEWGRENKKSLRIRRHVVDEVDEMYKVEYEKCDDANVVLARARQELTKFEEKETAENWQSADNASNVTEEEVRTEGTLQGEFGDTPRTLQQGTELQFDSDETSSDDETDHAKGEEDNVQAYNVFTNNCEHFARWCKTGDKHSYQILSYARKSADAIPGAIGSVAGRCAALSANGTKIGFKAVLSASKTQIGRHGIKHACKAASVGVATTAIEGAMFFYNWREANKAYKKAKYNAVDKEQGEHYTAWKQKITTANQNYEAAWTDTEDDQAAREQCRKTWKQDMANAKVEHEEAVQRSEGIVRAIEECDNTWKQEIMTASQAHRVVMKLAGGVEEREKSYKMWKKDFTKANEAHEVGMEHAEEAHKKTLTMWKQRTTKAIQAFEEAKLNVIDERDHYVLYVAWETEMTEAHDAYEAAMQYAENERQEQNKCHITWQQAITKATETYDKVTVNTEDKTTQEKAYREWKEEITIADITRENTTQRIETEVTHEKIYKVWREEVLVGSQAYEATLEQAKTKAERNLCHSTFKQKVMGANQDYKDAMQPIVEKVRVMEQHSSMFKIETETANTSYKEAKQRADDKARTHTEERREALKQIPLIATESGEDKVRRTQREARENCYSTWKRDMLKASQTYEEAMQRAQEEAQRKLYETWRHKIARIYETYEAVITTAEEEPEEECYKAWKEELHSGNKMYVRILANQQEQYEEREKWHRDYKRKMMNSNLTYESTTQYGEITAQVWDRCYKAWEEQMAHAKQAYEVAIQHSEDEADEKKCAQTWMDKITTVSKQLERAMKRSSKDVQKKCRNIWKQDVTKANQHYAEAKKKAENQTHEEWYNTWGEDAIMCDPTLHAAMQRTQQNAQKKCHKTWMTDMERANSSYEAAQRHGNGEMWEECYAEWTEQTLETCQIYEQKLYGAKDKGTREIYYKQWMEKMAEHKIIYVKDANVKILKKCYEMWQGEMMKICKAHNFAIQTAKDKAQALETCYIAWEQKILKALQTYEAGTRSTEDGYSQGQYYESWKQTMVNANQKYEVDMQCAKDKAEQCYRAWQQEMTESGLAAGSAIVLSTGLAVAFGTVIPFVGAPIGAVLGALAGQFGGRFLGRWIHQ